MASIVDHESRRVWARGAAALFYFGASCFFFTVDSAQRFGPAAPTAHLSMLIGPPTLLCAGASALPWWTFATTIIATLMFTTTPGTKLRSAAWLVTFAVWTGSGWISWASGI